MKSLKDMTTDELNALYEALIEELLNRIKAAITPNDEQDKLEMEYTRQLTLINKDKP